MEKNEIKKALYKENPKARMILVRKGSVYYSCNLNGQPLTFSIPFADIGDATFYPEMEAKLLIRYLEGEV